MPFRNYSGSGMSSEQVITNGEQMEQLATYIVAKVVRNKAAEITPDTPLVSSGLIDSFALIDIFLELQRIAGCKIPASKVQAKDMDTIRLMFAVAEKYGKPPKQ
ncbi:MAG: acyl carrier protein [Acidobacteria bacterium]|nr:acyl carrier protein [Acidobacteriota bacterium]